MDILKLISLGLNRVRCVKAPDSGYPGQPVWGEPLQKDLNDTETKQESPIPLVEMKASTEKNLCPHKDSVISWKPTP